MKTSININYQSRDNFQTCQVEQKQLKKNYSFNIHTQKNTHQEKKNIFSPLNNKYNHFIENLEAKNSNFNQTSPKDKTRIIPSSFPKKYITYNNIYDSSSDVNSPSNYEDLLIPNFDFSEEEKFVELTTCKVCTLNFQNHQEPKIFCRKCGLSVCGKCCSKTIKECPICDICIYKVKHNNCEKKKEDKIRSLNDERKNLSLELEEKNEKLLVLSQDLINLIKKTEEKACKQTDGCYNLKEKLKSCQAKKVLLLEQLQKADDGLVAKKMILEKNKEVLEKLKRERSKFHDRTMTNTNDQCISGSKILDRRLNDNFEISFDQNSD